LVTSFLSRHEQYTQQIAASKRITITPPITKPTIVTVAILFVDNRDIKSSAIWFSHKEVYKIKINKQIAILRTSVRKEVIVLKKVTKSN
jgi:hypothetical protein